MDQPAPPDPDGPQTPPSARPRASRAANLTLWSLFIGFSLLILIGTFVLKRAEDREHQEQMTTLARRNELGVNSLNAGFGLEVKKMQSRYQSSWAELTNPPVLDMALVKNRGDLKVREQKIGEFVAACHALLELSENPGEAYRRQLLGQQLAPETQESLVRAFTESLAGKNPQILALRQADVRRGEALLKAVAYLDSKWGQWDYVPDTRQIRFKDRAAAAEYESVLKEFSAAAHEVSSLHQQMGQPPGGR
jgi:hypothetical protein